MVCGSGLHVHGCTYMCTIKPNDAFAVELNTVDIERNYVLFMWTVKDLKFLVFLRLYEDKASSKGNGLEELYSHDLYIQGLESL